MLVGLCMGSIRPTLKLRFRIMEEFQKLHKYPGIILLSKRKSLMLVSQNSKKLRSVIIREVIHQMIILMNYYFPKREFLLVTILWRNHQKVSNNPKEPSEMHSIRTISSPQLQSSSNLHIYEEGSQKIRNMKPNKPLTVPPKMPNSNPSSLIKSRMHSSFRPDSHNKSSREVSEDKQNISSDDSIKKSPDKPPPILGLKILSSRFQSVSSDSKLMSSSHKAQALAEKHQDDEIEIFSSFNSDDKSS
ncbi:unnamed protein product [Moneuplotes crassus]|uniref:Uncharacterized protein n=1 Tax=Euplotes crassus TaxID=5936 RepID=A0AAD1U541_EUPCR|nr:unnamed protein product [Moneuplotes crassus]